MSNKNLNQTQDLDNLESNTEIKDDQTPLIFKNKSGEFRQIGRKCSLADLTSNRLTKLSNTADQDNRDKGNYQQVKSQFS